MDRNIIDAASGGALVNKTPAQAWDLIARMAENTQQFGSRDVGQMSGNNSEHAIQSMQQQLSELTSFVRKMVVEKSNTSVQVKVCGICTSAGHPTDACPTLQEERAVDVNTANYGMNRPPAYNPYSNTYNPSWRDHPNLHYGNAQQGNAHQPFGAMQQMQQPRFYEKQPPQAPTSNSNPSLEDLVKSMATSTLQFQQEIKSTVNKLQGQINQVSEEVKHLRERGKWPAQPEPNPANVSAITICSDTMIECSSRPNPRNTSAITLRSGKELEGPPPISKEQNEDKIEMKIEKEAELHENVLPDSVPPTETKSAPFPDRLKKPQKANKRKEMMEIFKKVELNIPLLEAINQIPKYAKFLKELCTTKRKLRGDEHIIAGENVSAVIKRKVPPKTGDPGMFSIPCKIGKTEITKAMLDLGAAINVMPRSIYDSLNLGPLKETGIIIQLADRTHAYPDGMIEDVLVQVNELIFPVDFYILDMHDAHCSNPPPLLLGRPFMCTAGTKIDVKKGTLSLEFDGEEFHFTIFNPIKCPVESKSLYAINVINSVVQETCEVGNENKRRTVLTKQLEKRPTGESKKKKKDCRKVEMDSQGITIAGSKKIS
ncbi:uncharacterized protein LOC127256816 [Andrographis paniculata]|uniref:uncharacterized protein LOC127256816 n=1 Tax=Andrographis paniculata TaxID=175694 RepID=UPI0021E6E027|nr:uncharacterized protein LOC127256816 [Andrographis paniculata]